MVTLNMLCKLIEYGNHPVYFKIEHKHFIVGIERANIDTLD